MLFQVYMRGMHAVVHGDPETPKDLILKRAIRAVGTFPIETAGEPVYIGANDWIVPLADAIVGPPIEAGSAEEAVAQREAVFGWMDKDLYAEPISE